MACIFSKPKVASAKIAVDNNDADMQLQRQL